MIKSDFFFFRALNSAAAMMLLKKSDSDKALNNGKAPKGAKKAKKKFKRSLTMTSLPLSFFKVENFEILKSKFSVKMAQFKN